MQIDTDIEYLISQLTLALEYQRRQKGEISIRPTVSYCFDCDKIGVDKDTPDGCWEHKTVSSDGYEHSGIESAITTLQHLKESADQPNQTP